MDRRKFLELSLLAGAGAVFLPNLKAGNNKAMSSIMGNDETNPRKIAIEKFRNTRYGMFIHYGLYSLLGRGEWVQINEKIRVDEYAKLKDQFTAKKFNADFITDLALDAGMKYINLTTRHHDSFCLWDTKYSDFKSTNSPAKRDLVGELSEQCNKKGLDFHLYYSHGRDWKHPDAPNNDQWGSSARPAYSPPEPSYHYDKEHDLNFYLQFMENQIMELLENYPSISSIWLDGIGVPLSGDRSLFKCQDLYDKIHAKNPKVLVSYKQGLLGTEDFLAPERKFEAKDKITKPLELCDHLQKEGWGYVKSEDGNHKSEDEVIQMLKKAHSYPANLLLNTGPLPSGQIHPEDVKVLRAVGKKINREGWDNLLKA